MKERIEISNIRDLINILDSAEINAKEVQAVKDEVGYDDSIYPDSEGNTITLTQYIHNFTQSLQDERAKLRTEIKEATQEYVKSQCSRTHVLIERETLTQMANKCQDAYDSADGVEYTADECRSNAEDMSSSLCATKEEVEYLKSDLETLAEQDMPVEAMHTPKPGEENE